MSSELEFNSMTKYFYTDRRLPKKKLTGDEMLEINQLYRIIGHCNDQLSDLANPDPPIIRLHRWILSHKPAVLAIAAGLLAVFILLRILRKPQYEN